MATNTNTKQEAITRQLIVDGIDEIQEQHNPEYDRVPFGHPRVTETDARLLDLCRHMMSEIVWLQKRVVELENFRLAEAIYAQAYPHSGRHRANKVREIHEWLVNNDHGGIDPRDQPLGQLAVAWTQAEKLEREWTEETES